MSDYAIKNDVVAEVLEVYRSRGRVEAFAALRNHMSGLQDDEVSDLLHMILISRPETRGTQKDYYRPSRAARQNG